MYSISYNDGWSYRKLNKYESRKSIYLPHDAMISEDRDPESAGGRNIAWFKAYDYAYFKTIYIDEFLLNKTLVLEFEGIYRNAEVYLNGKRISWRPYGFTNFYVELTGKIKAGSNEISVIVHNSDQPNCRWYTGAGIIRPVKLWYGEQKRINLNGLKVKTLNIDSPKISIDVDATSSGCVALSIHDATNINPNVLYSATVELNAQGKGHVELDLPNAQLWSPEHPQVYLLHARYEGDEAMTTFGIRTITYDDKGLCINGEQTILRGACIHSDNGLLGAAEDPDAVERKVKILRESGYNAVRSCHNPCSKTFLNFCDQYGLLVIDEYIDAWFIKKSKNDYVFYFDNWWRKDLIDMVEKDYNHPSVLMYSIGNDVSEIAQKRGVELAKQMRALIHSIDDTRPVTCAVNLVFVFFNELGFGIYKEQPIGSDDKTSEGKIGKISEKVKCTSLSRYAVLPYWDRKSKEVFNEMDIAGYNYGLKRYKKDLKKYPHRLIVGTGSFGIEAYDFYEIAKKNPRVIGDFVWTGMDYLGEVGIGNNEYSENVPELHPGFGWLTSGCGTIDITGKQLAESYYRKVAFEIEKGPFIAVVPPNHYKQPHSDGAWRMTDAIESWSWNGWEGKPVLVEVYARAAKVSLFINDNEIATHSMKNKCRTIFKTKYTRGILKAVSYDKDGKVIASKKLLSADQTTELRLDSENEKVSPGHICFIRAKYTDQSGILKPLEKGLLTVQIRGGKLVAFGNGCSYNPRGYLTDECDTYYGEALLMIRATGNNDVIVNVRDDRKSSESNSAVCVVPVIK